MGIAVTDRITRGTENESPFAALWEDDMKVSYVTVLTIVARDVIPEWKRIAYMTCYVVATDKVYRLGGDVTIAGQVWTEETFGLPSNVVTEDEIFDVDGFIQSQLIQNIFLNDSFVVDSEVAMLALTTGTGNFVIRSDSGDVYVKLNNDDPALIDDFALITYPGAVLTVNGDTGNVLITISDLITADVSGFNTAVTNSTVIVALSASVLQLQSDVDDIELVLEDKADLVGGTVPLAQLPYLFPNGVSLSGNNIILGGTLSDHVLIDGDSSYNFSIENIVELLFSITSSFELNYDDGVNTLGLVLDSTAGLRYLADISPTATAHTLVTKQYVDQRIADIGDGNPFTDNVALISNFTDPTKLAIFSAASITTATTRTYTLANASGQIPLNSAPNNELVRSDGVSLVGTGITGVSAGPVLAITGIAGGNSSITGNTTLEAISIVGNSTNFINVNSPTNEVRLRSPIIELGTSDLKLGGTGVSGANRDVSAEGSSGNIDITIIPQGAGLTNLRKTVFTAGTATAGTAPIKLTSGTALTTPENGAIEYHTSHLYFTIGVTRFQLDQQSGGITNGAASNEMMKSNGTNAVASGIFSSSLGSIVLGSASISGDRTLSVSSSTTNASLTITSQGTSSNSFVNINSSLLIVNSSGTTNNRIRTGFYISEAVTGALNEHLNITLDNTTNRYIISASFDTTDNDTYRDLYITGKVGSSGFVNGKRIVLNGGTAYSISGNGNGGDLLFTSGLRRTAGSGVDGNIYLDSLNGNIVLGTDTGSFGGGSKVTFIPNAVTSATSAPTNGIVLHAKDSSDGSANSTLAMYTEQAVEASVVFTQSHRLKVWVNNVEYYLGLDAV